MEGHAVVLIRYDASSLGVMNSWGEDWADGGFFKIENADTLNLIFYDIYFLETGLT